MTFYIHTYGCQMNERDSEAAAVLLRSAGHRPADGEREADLVVVNTCSVRGKAEAKALGKLGLLAAGKAGRPGRRVGVIGCMAQRMGERVFEKVPALDFAVGTYCLQRLPAVVTRVAERGGPVLEVDAQPGGEAADEHDAAGVAAYVTVLHGCDRRCTYCIVPSVRGPERSRPPGAVVAEVAALARRGVREVTLLGQSVMSYGRREGVWEAALPSPRGFREPLPRLLEALAGIDGLARLRFTSGHPSGCTDELARAMAELPAVCEHVHLPVQSGSDRVLARMRRGYTAAGYREAVARLRAAVPDVAVTTDVIVGFPGETARDFEATRRLMADVGFDGAFVFKYSPRQGTPAAEWPDDVPAGEKMRRNKLLLAEQDARSLRRHRALVGRTVEVLTQGVSPRNPARWCGRTRTNKIVVFEPPAGLRAGTLVQVEIERGMPQTLYGSAIH